MAYEALYRRYRPSRFKDAFFGQEHVVAALRNAVEGDRVGHAYLFSGPRGTGKTTSARILAKALNCTNLEAGEPCNECDSCVSFQTGSSYDLHELDAASNNGVDAMRDLISKVALGSPGRTKVYILDEVHMLSSGAENALLKTLEEPPPHVVFVLCTTEPNKVVPTIRSRTQHLEFSLLSANVVGEFVDYIVGDAGIEITPEDRSYVIRAGGGSARDTLSALDQVVAAGGAPQGGEHLDALFQALIDRDAPGALESIDGALLAGRDAANIATSLLHELRTVFLAAMRADVSHLPEVERDRATARAAAMSPARVTRAVEVIGTSVVEMRNAPDPRVDLEVALMRLTRADLDTDPAALVERLAAVEAQLAGGAPIAAAPAAVAHAQVPQPDAGQPAPVPPVAPAAQSAPAAQPAPVPEAPMESAPQGPAPAPAAAPSAGRRGADIVRAALVEQGITAAPASEAQAAEPAPAPAAGPAIAAGAGKTLADVRRERQAAAAGTAAPAEDAAAVEAAAAARRERQAAAQQAPQVPVEQAPQHQAPQVPVEQAPQHQAPQPVEQAPQHQAPQPVEQAPQQTPVEQAPQQVPVEQPPPQVLVEQAAAQQAPQQTPVEPAAAQQPPQQVLVEQAATQQPPQQTPVEPAAAQQPPQPTPVEQAPPQQAAGGAIPSLAEMDGVWQPLLESMSGKVRSRFSAGHFMESSADSTMFGLPNPVHRDRCEEIRSEVDQALAAQFGRPIPLTLVVDLVEDEPDFFTTPPSGGAGAVDEVEDTTYEEETVDVHDLVDATGDVPSAEDRVMATFEGSTLLEDPSNMQPDR